MSSWRPLVGRSSGALALTALLGASLVVTLALAFTAWRSDRALRAVAEGALRDQAHFAAARFVSDVEATLYTALSAQFAALRVTDAAGAPLDPAGLEAAGREVAECRCMIVPPAAGWFRYRVADTTLELGAASGARVALTPAARAWLREALARKTTTPDARRAPFGVLTGRAGGTTWAAPFRAVGGSAVGYVTTLAALADSSARQVYARYPLLPGHTANEGQVAVRVSDSAGATLFAAGDQARAEAALAGEAAFGSLFGAARVQTTLHGSAAQRLVVGGLPRSRLPFVLVAFSLAAGLVLVALLQFRREADLVRLRADFTSSVSHELRTPLAQILLWGETLAWERVRTRDERKAAAGIIVSEARRLIHMVENVLHFARAERGLERVRLEPVALDDVVRDAVEAFAPLAPPSVGWRLALAPGIVVDADRHAMRQVLLNLLDNAVKYGPPDGSVTLRLEPRGGRARLSVSDEGPGIPAADRERAWRPFTRLADTAGEGRTGAGIGLGVVHELVRLHGGSAAIEPAAGGGACVVIELPLATGTPRPSRDTTAGRDAPTLTTTRRDA